MQPDDGPEPHPRRNGRGDRQDLPPPFSPEQVYPESKDKAVRSLDWGSRLLYLGAIAAVWPTGYR